MLKVAGRPFLEILLDYLISQNIAQVVLSVGYKCKKIIDYFGNDYKSIKIKYSVEESPLGTGGAILNSMNKISDENFFVLNGDTLFNIDLKKLMLIHLDHDSRLTIALKEVLNSKRFGKVIIDKSNLISKFSEKKGDGVGLINGGIYLLNKSLFKDMNFDKSFHLNLKF